MASKSREEINERARELYHSKKALEVKKILLCVVCSIELSEEPHPNTKYCSSCCIDTRQQYSREFGRRRYQEGYRSPNYGTYARKDRVSLEDGCCAICGVFGSLLRDHDHNCCGKKRYGARCGDCERGPLCIKCNTGLGMFRDNKEFLNMAIKYLEEHENG